MRQKLTAPLTLAVDGKYEYTAADLDAWDADGPGSTFERVYPGKSALVRAHGLDPAQAPSVYDMSETRRWLGYEPAFSLRNLLDELESYGEAGPPYEF